MPKQNACPTSSMLRNPIVIILEWNLHTKLLYYSNFLLFPIITLNHIKCWLCISGLRSLRLHAVTFEQVVTFELWGVTPLKLQNLIWKSTSRLACIKGICTSIRNNRMKGLGRPKFTNLVAVMYITLHVVFKEVLCDF